MNFAHLQAQELVKEKRRERVLSGNEGSIQDLLLLRKRSLSSDIQTIGSDIEEDE